MKCKVSILTPSLNMRSYLERCLASVSDQGVPGTEHLVLDGGSDDETLQVVGRHRSVTLFSSKDSGMYDALNKGLAKARCDLIGHLNCDEQYLPGALAQVVAYMNDHPSVDLLFGDALLVNQAGELIAFRKGYPARWPYFLSSHLYLLSCTMFFRRRIIEAGFTFDSSYRTIGDLEFVVRLMRAGFRTVRLPGYKAAFTMTGQNLSLDPRAEVEWSKLRASIPGWVQLLRLPLNGMRLIEKAIAGAYHQASPLEYEIYAGGDLTKRRRFSASHPRHKWRFSDAADGN